jgi:ComF family protein
MSPNTIQRGPVDSVRGSRTRRLAYSFYAAAQRMARSTVDLVYPPQCACCGGAIDEQALGALCDKCVETLTPTGLPQCPRCGSMLSQAEQAGEDCARCRAERFQFDRVLAPARYEGLVRDVVLRMKRLYEEPLMVAMGRLLSMRFAEELRGLRLDVVVPIPMHWTRRLVRGTNSPELMGECVARSLGAYFGRRAIRRRRRTRKLADLPRQERKRTLRDAFAVAWGCDFAGARVLLVDDVLTTGTTCDTAARVLKNAGASQVSVLVAARAYPDD